MRSGVQILPGKPKCSGGEIGRHERLYPFEYTGYLKKYLKLYTKLGVYKGELLSMKQKSKPVCSIDMLKNLIAESYS